MKTKFITLVIALCAISVSAQNLFVGDESLAYDIMYKWGLINKKAGRVTINTNSQPGGTFSAILVGHSAKWADRFYSVRDTLIGTIIADGFVPVSYQKISHEGGEFKRDVISYGRQGDSVTANCERYHQKSPKKPVNYSSKMLKANGYTVDMLTAFYYMRFLDYPAMKAGDSEVMNIFSGKREEILTITYLGMETVMVNQVYHNCYKIRFSFSSTDGIKKTSEDLEAWISTEKERIPLQLVGKLPIGTIRCFYTPGNNSLEG